MPSSPPDLQRPRLRDRIASPDYFARVSEVTLMVDSAPDVGAVVDLLKQSVQLIGADAGTFFSRTATSFRFFLACEPQWYVEYERCAWYADDPWLEYAVHHAEPVLASDIPVRDGAQAELVRIARPVRFQLGRGRASSGGT